MWARLFVSQVFGFAAAYLASVVYPGLFGSNALFIVPFGAWFVTSMIVIIKL
jgi:hypothetical protein